jgi:predicted secreted Zn-dependent protease
MDLTGADWRKSTYSSNGGNCVEVATNLPGIVAVRDSKDPDGPALAFTDDEWSAFIAGVRAGEFDR